MGRPIRHTADQETLKNVVQRAWRESCVRLGENADVACDERHTWRLVGIECGRHGRDIYAKYLGGGIEHAKMARGGSSAAANVEDLERIMEGSMDEAVVHQLEQVGGLAVKTDVLSGTVVLVRFLFNSWTGNCEPTSNENATPARTFGKLTR